jgi:Ni/Co efflux regulator RcnB
MQLPRLPTHVLALLVSVGVAAPTAWAHDNDKDKGKGKGKSRHEERDRDRDRDRDGRDRDRLARFRQLDVNHDRFITRAEWIGFGTPAEFDAMDRNHDGRLTFEEFRHRP